MSTFVSRKKLSTTIYVTPEQNDRLKQLHERTKVPVAVYIREGIDLVLRQYAHLLPGQLPLSENQVEPAARLAAGVTESASSPPAVPLRASASEHGKK
jgi:ribbon-helix-helix protein